MGSARLIKRCHRALVPCHSTGRAPFQSCFWARTVSDLRLSAPRSPDETDRAQIDGTTDSVRHRVRAPCVTPRGERVLVGVS